MHQTDPEGWRETPRPPFAHPVDAVIYELHVRDASIHPESGIRDKGKFIGLCETGTRGPQGIPTGLDHIIDLGVTHVQLLPVNDYSEESVDETSGEPQFNWGYDPVHYNVPEGSYSTDPYDPYARIRELKKLVMTLHQKGLRVIQDVVYNHVFDIRTAHLEALVPGYYFRRREDGIPYNGSHCGNETASERPMMRKFILDSVLYWAKEYRVDGFRFDLMGLLDVDTMNEVRRCLDKIDPSLLVLGEGWYMDQSGLADDRRANQFHARRMPRIAQFNDQLRDSVKGSNFYGEGTGFVSGCEGLDNEVRKGIAGSIRYSESFHSFPQEPDQTINYVECHDNLTLWDKLLRSGEPSGEVLRQMHRLASAIVLTSQGIPFLQAGQEFMRTKRGQENSYNLPDEINRLDWERCAERRHDVWFMKELIALRKAHPAFRLRTAEEIKRHLVFEATPAGVIGFTLRHRANGDPARHLYVLYSARRDETEVPLPGSGRGRPSSAANSSATWITAA
ncbi:type I pullulanase [Paenibacillus sp. CC-CFT747]|nr:type I pullulanase [Paenibacillus sp. CC-CFT747]